MEGGGLGQNLTMKSGFKSSILILPGFHKKFTSELLEIDTQKVWITMAVLFHFYVFISFIQLIRLDPCPLINEIMDLVKREEQLVDRGVRTSNLSGLRQRILTRYMQLIRTPAHNPEITRFENQLPVPVLHSAKPKEYKRGGANTEFCHSCRNYLPRTKFSLSSGVVSLFLNNLDCSYFSWFLISNLKN
jgi:hypothetical protein